jgi:S1-C subfamily serine protease
MAVLFLVCPCCRAAESTKSESADQTKEIARSIELLRKPDKSSDGRYYSVREEAAAALGTIGPSATNAVPALIEALNDEKPRVRWAAAAALGNIGPGAKAAVPALTKHVERRDEGNEEELKALGKIGFAAKTAIPAIIAHMRSLQLIDVTKEENTSQARHLYVHAASLIRIAEGIRDNVDTQSIPALESVLLVLEDFNFPPKVIRLVREPLTFLRAEVAAGRGPPPTLDEIARCWNLVVQIEGELNGQPITGSGIIFGHKDDRLYIATAKHVVRRELSKPASFAVKSKSLRPGETLAADLTSDSAPGLDLAVLVVRDIQKYKIAVETIPFDRVGKPQSLQANGKVYALGLPITQVGEPLQSDEFMETSVSKLLFRSNTVRAGYSGGALFNANWQLVGMIRADEPPFAHAIAIDQILGQLKEWGYPVNLKAHTP